MSESKWSFAQNFYAEFQVKAAEITSRLDDVKRDNPSLETVQAVAADVSRLAKSLADATGSLPSYDQRQCEMQLKSLEKAVEVLRGAPSAVSKFAFRRKVARPEVDDPATRAVPIPRNVSPATGSVNALSSLSCRYLTSADFEHRDVSGELTLSDLASCIVNLLPKDNDNMDISAIHVQRLTDCILLLPRISGSILLHNLSNCALVAGCYQFRMHSSTNVDVYLFAVSNPIIEHCSSIRFAGYPDALLEDPVQQNNTALAVQDFSHIRSTPSPNWSVLPEDHRQRCWPVSLLEGQGLLDELKRILPGNGISRN
ncbi:tubulin binding cofactor C-domain-containing protein [Pisolithus croceorrhizus]|nr:tubulin binding cofactor C-domain-containing protein [Pisolithus croceorrhizus]